MKKSVSLLSNLLVSSTLFWGVPMAHGEEDLTSEAILKVPANDAGYCHMKFPPIRVDTLSWEQPVLNHAAGNVIDFYGPCDHDPLGREEIDAQKRLHLRAMFEDGD